jgi:uncharacterized lipoprotein YddW (UPF0748 family)
MKMIKLYRTSKPLSLLFFLFFLIQNIAFAQAPPPKRELRGVWIASVLNIDYPSVQTTDEYTLKTNWVNILNQHKSLGINTLYVQVRPCADAIYPSVLVPWSVYLTGKSGQAPANNFDPLAFMIETAHNMGFEFHAWLNPYRTSMDNQGPDFFHESHIMRQHPEWCIKYGKRYILNPGIPEVRAHVNMVVEELIKNYNIDGIHFDDYFYPYKVPGEQFPDYQTFQQYNDGISNLEDWRRHNIDLLIYQLSKNIKKIKPRVQFGISPFGVWRNGNKDPEGTATQAGLTCYDDLYADVRKWLREGWIDYVIPQIYWQIGFGIADHEKIARWWSENSAGKPVYIGHGAYRVGQNSGREPAWTDPAEIGRQIQLSRSLPNVKGSVYFSSKSLISNPLGIADTLRNNYYMYPAIPPTVIRDTSLLECDAPEVRQVIAENNTVILRWKPSAKTLKRQPFQYIIYRFDENKIDFTDGKNIRAMVPHDSKELMYLDTHVSENLRYHYAITVVDCNNVEIPTEDIYTIGDKKSPANNTTVTPPTQPTKETKVVKKKKKCGFFKRVFGKCK